MASFGAQAAIRSKWTDLVESTPLELPGEVSSGVRSVVGWLKQASLEVRQAGKRTLSSIGGSIMANSVDNENNLTILHYNDVYNIESRNTEPVGGAARFSSKMKSYSHLNPLILFSGDIFSPSMLSTVTKGKHMVPVLNEVQTHCALFGNHDFDFGLEVLSQWTAECNFPWLMSNVIDNETGRPLGDGKISHLVQWQNRAIGIIGLVEKEWLDTLPTINPEQITFMDFVEAGEKLASQLKREGCDYVIALTHMRTPNDILLANEVADIDLILGGHDHVYEVREVNGKTIIKSGTDFRQFSKITLTFSSQVDVKVEEINVTKDVPEDPAMKALLDEYANVLEDKLDEVLGTFAVPLDGRFSSVRTSETNLGNWICDVVLAATNADCVIINSGTLRSDTVHAPGEFTIGDLMYIIPMMDPLVILSVTDDPAFNIKFVELMEKYPCIYDYRRQAHSKSDVVEKAWNAVANELNFSGKQILAALENGVSGYPKLEGRFPQVAGISFAFDPNMPPSQRVDPQFVRIGDEYLQLDAQYRLATKIYLYEGCDGYDVLKSAKLLVDEEGTPELGLAVRNHFQAINVRMGKTNRHSKHRQSLVTLSRRHSLVKSLDVGDGPPVLRDSPSRSPTNSLQPTKLSNIKASPNANRSRLSRRASVDDLEQESCELTPKLEHRIVLLTNETRKELHELRKRQEADSVIPEVDTEDSF